MTRMVGRGEGWHLRRERQGEGVREGGKKEERKKGGGLGEKREGGKAKIENVGSELVGGGREVEMQRLETGRCVLLFRDLRLEDACCYSCRSCAAVQISLILEHHLPAPSPSWISSSRQEQVWRLNPQPSTLNPQP
jgi:hypothetical protein